MQRVNVDGKARVAPYIPTPRSVMNAVMEESLASRARVFYDLGCGDGRMLVYAAKHYGLKSIGYEIDEDLCTLAEVNAAYNGVEGLVEVRCESFYNADLGDADIVYAYLFSSILDTLKPVLKTAPVGSRIAVLDLPIPGWLPVRVRRLLDESGVPRAVGVYVRGLSDDKRKRPRLNSL